MNDFALIVVRHSRETVLWAWARAADVVTPYEMPGKDECYGYQRGQQRGKYSEKTDAKTERRPRRADQLAHCAMSVPGVIGVGRVGSLTTMSVSEFGFVIPTQAHLAYQWSAPPHSRRVQQLTVERAMSHDGLTYGLCIVRRGLGLRKVCWMRGVMALRRCAG